VLEQGIERLVDTHLQLAGAVKREDFAQAAELRDEMARLRQQDRVLAVYSRLQAAVEQEDFDEVRKAGVRRACAVCGGGGYGHESTERLVVVR
jgi:protein-arginine kinase activator protein McsA